MCFPRAVCGHFHQVMGSILDALIPEKKAQDLELWSWMVLEALLCHSFDLALEAQLPHQ